MSSVEELHTVFECDECGACLELLGKLSETTGMACRDGWIIGLDSGSVYCSHRCLGRAVESATYAASPSG